MCTWLQSKNGNTVELDLTSSVADLAVQPIRTGKASSHRNERLSKVSLLAGASANNLTQQEVQPIDSVDLQHNLPVRLP